MRLYQVYGNDNNILGGPIFSPQRLSKVRAKSPKDAIKILFAISRRNNWGWSLSDLTARCLKEAK